MYNLLDTTVTLDRYLTAVFKVTGVIPHLFKRNDCIEWLGGYIRDRVPVVYVDRVNRKPLPVSIRSAIAYIFINGCEPGRARMRCGNKKCVNPNHFRAIKPARKL